MVRAMQSTVARRNPSLRTTSKPAQPKSAASPAATPVKKTTVASPKHQVDHPSFLEMVKLAIDANKSRSGTSKQVIERHIHANYTLHGTPSMIKLHMRNAVLSGVKSGLFIQVKGTGFGGSFKNAEAVKSPKKTARVKLGTPKKAAPKKVAVKKAAPTDKKITAPK